MSTSGDAQFLKLPSDVVCNVKIHTITSPDLNTSDCPIETFLGDDFSLPDVVGDDFRWIHVPVNHMAWAEVSIIRRYLPRGYNAHGRRYKACVRKCQSGCRLGPAIGTWRVRPALSKSIRTPLHARHMEPSCIERRQVTLDAEGPKLSTTQATEDTTLPLLTLYVCVDVCVEMISLTENVNM
jgi:hypothetical protein